MDRSKVYVDLIDLMFAVIIAVSFTDFKAILVPPSPEFRTATLLLAYITVVASWVGYHIAVEKHPHKDNRFGLGRFIIDLILLYLYFYLINSVENFNSFLFMFPIIFGLYLVWVRLRIVEYPEDQNLRQREGPIRIKRSVASFAGCFCVWIFYVLLYSPQHQKIFLNATLVEWLAWIMMLIIVIVFRMIPSVIFKR